MSLNTCTIAYEDIPVEEADELATILAHPHLVVLQRGVNSVVAPFSHTREESTTATIAVTGCLSVAF